MKTNETIKWQEEQALRRYQLIAPLLDESLDNAKRIRMREAVAEQNGLSPRTLYRYEAAYRKGGFPGLKPQDRCILRVNRSVFTDKLITCHGDLDQ